jgi:hypothetical protein
VVQPLSAIVETSAIAAPRRKFRPVALKTLIVNDISLWHAGVKAAAIAFCVPFGKPASARMQHASLLQLR